MQNWRKTLLPFSLVYAIITRIRNFLFDSGRLKSVSFPVPVIGIGNLTAGGTGKTPHVEYLIKLLKNEFYVATLSRGYGRKSKGYIIAELPTNTRLVGDEPMQYLFKFKDILVCVSESRSEAIRNLLGRDSKPEVILMDDAFQHRKVKPGINILLIEYDNVLKNDLPLPAGNMREPFSSAKRADIIIISKSPAILAPIEKKKITEYLQNYTNKPVFFTYMKYGELTRIFGPQNAIQMGLEYYRDKNFAILLIAGIANPSGLIEYLRRFTDKLEILIFHDHHEFNQKDIQKIQQTFDNIANLNKIIITTEKDSMRLRNPDIDVSVQKLPVFYLPIQVAFHQEEDQFKKIIQNYVRKYKTNSGIYKG